MRSISRFATYFEKKVLKLVEEENPTLVICTHSFPSRMIGRLKGNFWDVSLQDDECLYGFLCERCVGNGEYRLSLGPD